MNKLYFLLIGCILLASCDKLAVEKDDVVRFDYKLAANSTSFELNNTVVEPYETEELKKYKEEREKIEEFEIYRVEFRMYTFRADNDSTRIEGEAKIISDAGTEFDMELFEVGNEYKDTENHEIHKLTAGNQTGEAAYDALAQEVVNADQFTLDMGNLSGVVDSLDCDLSIYIHYRIKAQ